MEKIRSLDCILLIDDDDATNFIHKILIHKIIPDVQVHEAFNGIIALEYLTHTGKYADLEGLLQPGIILLDINMPGMNGWEFLELYKELPESQKARIVVAMLTTSLNPDDKKRAKAYNFEIKEFFNKPLTKDNFQMIVDKYFEAE